MLNSRLGLAIKRRRSPARFREFWKDCAVRFRLDLPSQAIARFREFSVSARSFHTNQTARAREPSDCIRALWALEVSFARGLSAARQRGARSDPKNEF